VSDHRAELRRLAEERFGRPRLRDDQIEAMEAVMSGRDVLAVLPTGAGKSAIYQVPALLLNGPTVVVSPLIALQHDQIDGIDENRVPEAVALNSAQSDEEYRRAWQAVRDGTAEYLFLSPENWPRTGWSTNRPGWRFPCSSSTRHTASRPGDTTSARPRWLAPVIERLGHPRVVILTATAALPVRRDIISQLGLRDHREIIASFDRPKLRLAVERFTDDTAKSTAVIARIRTLTADPATGPGLLYAASRKDTDSYASELAEIGVWAASYHAGMKAVDREQMHQEFLTGELGVVVASSSPPKTSGPRTPWCATHRAPSSPSVKFTPPDGDW
jgi:ATP-dependent DNA helicase RecQ